MSSEAQRIENAFQILCDPSFTEEYRSLTSKKRQKVYQDAFVSQMSAFLQSSVQMSLNEDMDCGHKTKQRSVSNAIISKEKKALIQMIELDHRRNGRKKVDWGKPDVAKYLENVITLCKKWGAREQISPAEKHLMHYQMHYLPQAEKKDRLSMCSTSSNVKKGNVSDGNMNVGYGSLVDFSQLTPCSVSELELFSTKSGYYLEGTIITPPMVMSAIHVCLSDKQKGQIIVSLYNCCSDPPNTLDGEASRTYKVGNLLKIANPFSKLGTDGARNVRVDDPREVSVIDPKYQHISISAGTILRTAKSKGNEFLTCLIASQNKVNSIDSGLLAEKARSAYLEGLTLHNISEKKESHHLDLMVKLINNRGFMALKLNEFESALADFSLVLFLQPKNVKAQHRYHEALMGMKEEKIAEAAKETFALKRNNANHKSETENVALAQQLQAAVRGTRKVTTKVFLANLREIVTNADAKDKVKDVTAPKIDHQKKNELAASKIETPSNELEAVKLVEKMKIDGNAFFTSGNFKDAKKCFTQAILFLNSSDNFQPLAPVLTNLSLSCLHAGRFLEAGIAGIGAMRVLTKDISSQVADEGEIKRLGLLKKAVNRTFKAFFSLAEHEVEEGVLTNAKVIIALKNSTLLFEENQKLLTGFNKHTFLTFGEFVHPFLYLKEIPGKGRGIFCSADIQAGTELMRCYSKVPGLYAKASTEDGMSMSMGAGEYCFSSISQTKLKKQVMQRVSDDLSFCFRLTHLHDNKSSDFTSTWMKKYCALNEVVDSSTLEMLTCERLSPIILPLLPPTKDFMNLPTFPNLKGTDVSTILGISGMTETRIENILSTNIFGDNKNSGFYECHSVLHIGISLFNHKKFPDVLLEEFDDSSSMKSAVLARDCKRGEELCVCYGDKSLEKWNIKQ